MKDFAIDDNSLAKLYKAAASLGGEEIQDRNEMVLSLFEHTGAKLRQIINITTADVLKALKGAEPGQMVLIPLHDPQMSPVNGWQHAHYVPVSQAIVIRWVQYIHTSRSSCLKGQKCDDEGYLLIDTRTGERLTIGSIFVIIDQLCNAAGIPSVPARMLSNRFFIKAHQAATLSIGSDAADKKSKKFMDMLKKMTGHTYTPTIEHFLDMLNDSSHPAKD